MRFELLQGLNGVVDQSEASALATTELRAETEDGDLILVSLVEAGELLTEFILGNVGAVGVEDVTRGVFVSLCWNILVCPVCLCSPTSIQNPLPPLNCFPSRSRHNNPAPSKSQQQEEMLTRPSVSDQAEGCG